MIKLFYYAFVLLIATGAEAQPTSSEWSAFTSMRNVSRLLVDGDYVWTITSGGVLRFDQQARTYDRFTRLDGLPGNSMSSLAIDASGHLWFGTRFQGLSRFRPQEGRFDDPYLDFSDLAINALYAHDDRLFVGTERGISAFLIDKGEVKETYRQLGNLAKDTEVTSITVFANSIWVGTEAGLAWADLGQPNLQDPESWNSSSIVGQVRDLIVFEDTLYAATGRGLWTAEANLERPTIELSRLDIVALGIFAGRLVGANAAGDFYERHERLDWRLMDSPGISGIADLSRSAGPLWVATQTGLRAIGTERLPPTRDPSANSFYDLGLSSNGDLWAASVPKDGFLPFGLYQFDGEGWTVHNLSTGLSSEIVTSVDTDASGQLWVGNWGRGIDVLDSVGTWHRLNSDNSALEGIGGGAFVPISDMERDAQGRMWIADVQSGLVVMDGYPIRNQLLNRQQDFGLPTGRDIGKISIGPDGLVWVATARDGFILFDDGGTPFESGDEVGLVFNSLDYADMKSDRTSDILADRAGRVWVGSDNGLNSVRGTYSRTTGSFALESWSTYHTNTGLPSGVITALTEDDRGNIWVGTEDGLAQIGAAGAVNFVLNTSNSGLIDNRINSLLFDGEKSELWVGTLDGLSRLQIQGGNSAGTAVVQIYPNPLSLGARGGVLTLAGLPLGAEVGIFTANGQLVRQIIGEPGQGSVLWDGLNEAGFLVGSGIYFFVASDGTSKVRGKFAVVNQR
ncbi:MAG: ligand-binding sensor domain-containing protein [Candidatus Latescibacterota bacterium]|jgi:ligand-binding sensor domain-containing protein